MTRRGKIARPPQAVREHSSFPAPPFPCRTFLCPISASVKSVLSVARTNRSPYRRGGGDPVSVRPSAPGKFCRVGFLDILSGEARRNRRAGILPAFVHSRLLKNSLSRRRRGDESLICPDVGDQVRDSLRRLLLFQRARHGTIVSLPRRLVPPKRSDGGSFPAEAAAPSLHPRVRFKTIHYDSSLMKIPPIRPKSLTLSSPVKTNRNKAEQTKTNHRCRLRACHDPCKMRPKGRRTARPSDFLRPFRTRNTGFDHSRKGVAP
jgi:hypothetical protein